MNGYSVLMIYTFISIMMVLVYIIGEKYSKTKSRRIPFIWCICFALMFSNLNVICTTNSNGYGGDRANYYYQFVGGRDEVAGLSFLFSIWHNLNLSFESFLYFSTFVCCFITFIAFSLYENKNIRTLIFLLSTNYVFFTFTGLKECYACAFSSLFFALLSRHKGKSWIPLLLLCIITPQFHVTGYILLPILIYYYIVGRSSSKIGSPVLRAALIALVFGFIGNNLIDVLPDSLSYLSDKLDTYFGDNTSLFGLNNAQLLIKGIPSFTILFLAARQNGVAELRHDFKANMIACILGAAFYAVSVYSYWMFRFTYLFYLPMGVMYSQTVKDVDRAERLLLDIGVIGISVFFTFRNVFNVFQLYGRF